MARKRNRKPVVLRAKHAAILERLAALGVGEFMAFHLHPLTRKYLCSQDWLMYSGRFGESYALTGRGLEVLRAWQGRGKRRRDGICPSCGIEPRIVGYCKECHRKRSRRWYAERGHGHSRNEGKCARCDAPRHRSANGLIYPYCAKHQKEVNRDWGRQRYERMKAAQDAGEPMMCKRCGQSPAYISPTGRSAASYCLTCLSRGDAMRRKLAGLKRVLGVGIGGRA